MKNIFDIAKGEWSFYVFIFISPVTWLLYTGFFGIPGEFIWVVPHMLSFLCSGILFFVIMHKVRGEFLDNTGVTKFNLAKQLFSHSIKTCICMFPIQIIAVTIMSVTITGENFLKSPHSMMAMLLPFSFIISMWMLAGSSFVIFTGSSRHSIKNSFIVLHKKLKPISLLTLIGFGLNGFAYLRQSVFPKSGIFWMLIDIVPLYFGLAFVVLGLSFISISLENMEFKPKAS